MTGGGAPLLVYGATGYTGGLVARAALARGLPLVLAGRAGGPLDAPAAVRAGLDGVAAVLHCAGPFSATAAPMAAACLAAGVHYLDVTGEVGVFEALWRLDGQARAAGVTLLPGTGFDVVPSDCLAVHLARRLPGAVRLTLAFQAIGRPSRGTSLTALEGLGRGGLIRRRGCLEPVPAAWRARTIDLGEGPVRCMSVPWGDVFTAGISTGLPEVVVYMAAPPGLWTLARAGDLLPGLARSPGLRRWLSRRVHARPAGPTAEERARGRCLLWGEVADADGNRACARLRVAEGYAFTAEAAVACAARVLAGGVPTGFQTPAMAFGPDFVLSIAGTTRTDLPG